MIAILVTTNHHTFQARAVQVDKAKVIYRASCTSGYDAAAKALALRFYGQKKADTVREIKAQDVPGLNAYIRKLTSPTPFQIFTFDQ